MKLEVYIAADVRTYIYGSVYVYTAQHMKMPKKI